MRPIFFSCFLCENAFPNSARIEVNFDIVALYFEIQESVLATLFHPICTDFAPQRDTKNSLPYSKRTILALETSKVLELNFLLLDGQYRPVFFKNEETLHESVLVWLVFSDVTICIEKFEFLFLAISDINFSTTRADGNFLISAKSIFRYVPLSNLWETFCRKPFATPELEDAFTL